MYVGNSLVERPLQVEIGQTIVMLKDIRLGAGTLMAYHCVFSAIPVPDTFFFQVWRRVVRLDGLEQYRLVAQSGLTNARANHTVTAAAHCYFLLCTRRMLCVLVAFPHESRDI